MNIMFFTHEREYGGASRALVNLIEDLKDDNNIYVVVPFKKAKIVKELKKMNVNVIYQFYSWNQYPTNLGFIKRLMFKIIYRFNFISYFILKRKIKKLNIDIIHSNTSVIDIGCKIAHSLKIKHVWHFREFTGVHLKYINSENKTYDFINKKAGKIIYISKDIQKFYEKHIDKKLGVLIYDGIPNIYNIEKKYEKKEKVTFLLASTLEENKGQMIALKAAKLLKDNEILDFELLLAGGNPTGYLNIIDEFIEKNSLKKYVKYIGFVDDMNSLRKKVDVELMCAPREAFGLVTVEAMLAGSAVIGSESGATKEIILDGKTGFLFNKDDEVSLYEKMKEIIKNRSLIEKFGKEGKKRAQKEFSSKKNYEQTIKLYKSLGGVK